MQNAFIESFNGRPRDELLNETLFTSLAQTRIALGCWRADYNDDRLGCNYSDVRDTIQEFMRRGVVVRTVINGLTFDGATKDPMQHAVRDALIGFLAATAQANAEAIKEAQRGGSYEGKGRRNEVPRTQAQLHSQPVHHRAGYDRAVRRDRPDRKGYRPEPTGDLSDQGRSSGSGSRLSKLERSACGERGMMAPPPLAGAFSFGINRELRADGLLDD